MYAQVDVTNTGRARMEWLTNEIVFNGIPSVLKYNGAPVTPSFGGFKIDRNFAIIADQNSFNCFLFNSITGELTLLGQKYGTNCVGFTKDGMPVWQDSATTYRVGPNSFPLPPEVQGASDGFLFIDSDDKPVWTALNNPKIIQGVSFGMWNQAGPWTVGLSSLFYGIIAYNSLTNKFYKVYEANVPYSIPRVNETGTVAVSIPGEFITSSEFVELDLSNNPSIEMQTKPFPQPLWLAPYHSFNLRTDYGDNPDYQGNAILVVEGGRNNVLRLVSKGLPLIVFPEDYIPEAASLVVAYYLHTQTLAEMELKVNDLESKINSGSLPDLPAIVYYDQRNWPANAPAFLNKDIHWLSLQCYRNPGESVSQFDTSIRAELTKIWNWGFTQVPTLMFYTRNGALTELEVIETFPLIRPWFDIFTTSPIDIIGLLPFSDRRPTGMVTHPSFEEYFNELCFLNLERPNRYSGWIPRKSSIDEVLKNILSQSRTEVVLSKERKDYLKSFLGNGGGNPPTSAPDESALINELYATWAPFDDNVDAHNFVRACARELRRNDKRWGMLTKNPGENQCTTHACGNNVTGGLGVDVLCYLLGPDINKDNQQIDILTDFGPNAKVTWREIPRHENRVGNNWTDNF